MALQRLNACRFIFANYSRYLSDRWKWQFQRTLRCSAYHLTSKPVDVDNVILMGSPGSGKTTVGKIVASRMNKPHIDVDNDFLESFWAMPVTDKLSQVGGDNFVQEEGEAVKNLNASGSVISLSGSNPMHTGAMNYIKQLGLVVFLDVPNSDVLHRLEKMKVDRIVGQTDGIAMQDILKYRQQFYEGNYDIRVACEPFESPEKIGIKVQDAVEQYQRRLGYVSTREDLSRAPFTSFNDAVLQGLACDGGLFVPIESPPLMSVNEWQRMIGLTYQERALRILEKWIHPLDIHPSKLEQMINLSYSDNFNCKKVFPVVHLANDKHKNTYIAELFHGPSASFKDAALQLMPRFFTHAMEATSVHGCSKYLILVATSGDTGGAVLDGFSQHSGASHVKIMVLYPEHGISSIQKAQMTSMEGENVHVVGVKSDFDFCQGAIKHIFNDALIKQDLLQESNCKLSAANSINWGRLLPQIVYHASTYLDMVSQKKVLMGSEVDLCIPTGNFGNLLAAYYAKQMGIPFRRFICASNENNILSEFFNTGYYNLLGRKLRVTSSPAMDILKSSNLERLLYHIFRRNHKEISELYMSLETHGRFAVPKIILNRLQTEIVADWCTADSCLEAIKKTYKSTGYLMDPHTAVAKVIADKENQGDIPMLIASTAHYGKFAEDVLKSLGLCNDMDSKDPKDLFDKLSNLKTRPIMHQQLVNSVLKPRRHNTVLEPSITNIVSEVKSFAKNGK